MGTVGDPQPFRAHGPLPPPGITVVEASAGTGKTYTLTSLVVRFVGEGVPLSEMLAVTFTRMATGELRDRVRSRLVDAHVSLGETLLGGAVSEDETLAEMARGSRQDIELRRHRLGDALAEFDAATIATTHGFCQLVLHGLGTAGDALPGTTLLEDPADLMEEVVEDLYLRRRLLHPADDPPFSLAQARMAAYEATRNPDARLVPEGGDDERGLLRRLAEQARRDIGRRLLEENQLTYDQLLHRLARTLDDPERGPEACRRLAERYGVVLVDEFQDTDPVQWTVLRRAFAGGRTRLILIGDPKQAVYGFRGADVHAYLEAAEAADAFYTLDTNWRADQPLLDATAALFQPLQFGHESICFRSVRAPAGRQLPGIRGDDRPAAMRWRLVGDHQKGVALTTKGLLSKGSLRDWVARDVARDVSRLLGSSAELQDGDKWRPLLERDVAVLTRTNTQALAVRDALRSEGVVSVVAGLDSVFRSEAADAWLRLLEALQEPSSRSRAAAVALGPFVGMDRGEAATAPESRWEALHDQLHRWAAVMGTRGVAALYSTVTAEQLLPGRVLARPGGERVLTDLGHVAQLLHSEAAAGQLGAPSLRNWLATRIRSVADEQADAEDRSRRLDSDAEAVQVLTVHGAKGLEFPVVYCPYMWDAGPPERGSPPVLYHDPDCGGRRTLDVGDPRRQGAARHAYLEHAAWGRAERRAEDLRLLYVACTRARHRLVIWWGRTQDCRHSPLGRLLVGRDPLTGHVRDSKGTEPGAKDILGALEAVMARAPELIAIEMAGDDGQQPGRSRREAVPSEGALRAARFTRSLDSRWKRSSYSSITAAVHGGGPEADPVGSEPEHRGVTDEPAGDLATVSPLAGIAGGVATGTFVHHVLEATDFSARDLDAVLVRAVEEWARRHVEPVDTATLVAGLTAALTTPLDPLLPGVSLSDLARTDRLDELAFELPVAGGEHPSGSLWTSDIADLILDHVSDQDRLQSYPRRLADPLLETGLRGYLTGSLDLVFRRTTAEGNHRWYVADYKTNWLGSSTDLLRLGDYAPSALDQEMERRHYPLQALIYLVALHRYLRWRQDGYLPDRDLGGVLYLFLRGMAGPGTPLVDGARCGVWTWEPPSGLVPALSDLFEHGRTEEGL